MLSGGCFCRRVRYQADGEPFHETICHCVDCRRVVGAASVAWFTVPRTGFHITAGSPTRFASSPGVTRTFCGVCGTSLTYASDAHADEIDLTICSLDDPEALPPKDHTMAQSKLSWVQPDEGLPVYPRMRPGR
jgi:hypothetical protein